MWWVFFKCITKNFITKSPSHVHSCRIKKNQKKINELNNPDGQNQQNKAEEEDDDDEDDYEEENLPVFAAETEMLKEDNVDDKYPFVRI